MLKNIQSFLRQLRFLKNIRSFLRQLRFLKNIQSFLRQLRFNWHWSIAKNISHEKMEKISSLISPQETNFELVRIGGENDGGYLLPNDFSNLSACYSPGVGDSAEFELSMSQKGIKCFLADASVNKSPIKNENIHFDKMFIGAKTKDNKITLCDWIDKYSKNTDDLILQMDIEGDEYEVLEKTSVETLSRFRIIIIEFHRTHLILTKNGYRKMIRSLEKIHKNFIPVHLHNNNARPFIKFNNYLIPRVFELTFIRRDRVKHFRPVKFLPHHLDQPNVAGLENPKVPDWMYGRQIS